MRHVFCVPAVVLLLVSAMAPGFAHDGNIGSPENPIEFPNLNEQTVIHENEQEPWKGLAFVYVKNTGTKAWTDFHFKIVSWNNDDISNVVFKDASMGGQDPVSSQSPLSWAINNTVVGAEMTLWFVEDPVYPGQVATFQIYTDNTIDQVQFGLCMFPSIPEPSAIVALATGLIGVAGMARRRRR